MGARKYSICSKPGARCPLKITFRGLEVNVLLDQVLLNYQWLSDGETLLFCMCLQWPLKGILMREMPWFGQGFAMGMCWNNYLVSFVGWTHSRAFWALILS
jgi:hypothetical protein